MLNDWKNWCRLCASEEPIIKIESISELLPIIQKFSSHFYGNSSLICSSCFQLLNVINKFTEKCAKVDKMYSDLLLDINTESDLTSLKLHYGLENGGDAEHITIAAVHSQHVDHQIINVEEVEIKQESGYKICLVKNITSTINEDSDELSDTRKSPTKNSTSLKSCIKKTSLCDPKENQFSYVKTEDEKFFDFICQLCQQDFPKMCFLKKHCKELHGCLPKVTCICGKSLSSWKRLLIHKRKHYFDKSVHHCDQCTLVFVKQETFEAHIKAKHSPESEKYACDDCGKLFAERNVLRKHKHTHLPNELKSTHECSICQKRFVNKNSLGKHVEIVHSDGTDKFTCEVCGKTFKSKSGLKDHSYSHLTVKEHECSICQSKFKTAKCLKKHGRIHNNPENFLSCPECGNRYKTKQNLSAHMICHSDYKKYKCTICPNEYKRSKDLKCHLSLHSGKRDYACQFCGRTFNNGSNCRKHKLKDHNQELLAFEAINGKGRKYD